MKLDTAQQQPANKNITIIIPEEIAERPGLSLVEKIALAFIDRYPRYANHRLARELGMSLRGIENLLVRLRHNGQIVRVGKGCARTLRLTFHVEHHLPCENRDVPEKNTECGTGAPSAELAVAKQSVPECSYEYFAFRRDFAVNCLAAREYDAALAHFADLRRIAEHDLTGEALDKVLAILADDETVALGAKLINESVKSRTQRTLMMAALGRATPEQLTIVRQRLVDQAALGNPATVLAICS